MSKIFPGIVFNYICRLYTEYVEFFDSGILILDFKDLDQNSSVFQSENLMTMEFL